MKSCSCIVESIGVYGDVFRVKIMFNKKDTALVQFADPAQAQIGELTHILLLCMLCFSYYCNCTCIILPRRAVLYYCRPEFLADRTTTQYDRLLAS